MKFLAAAVVFLLCMVVNVFAQETDKEGLSEVIKKEFLSEFKISGYVKVVSKIEESFTTPLDNPEFGLYNRAGANYRSSQNFRTRGSVNMSIGNPGKSEWFGVVTLEIDANDPDTDYYEGEGDREIVGVDNFFIMYRPFELMGGRPLGISVGIQTIKATANAAYGYYFAGDIDEDFIFYTAAAASQLPMVNVDFHIDEGTGIGFAIVKGNGDISRIGTGMRSESALNKTIWLEFKRWNIGLNAGYQMIGGESGGTKLTETDDGNTIHEYDPQYDHILFNAQLAYTYHGFTPFVGYQIVKGDNVPTSSTVGLPIREVCGSFMTYGGKFEFNLFGVKNTLAGDYTIADTEKFDGINGLPKGLVGALTHNALFADVGGESSVAYAIAKLDGAMHIEYAVQIKEKLKLSLFYYDLMGKSDETMSDEYVHDSIVAELTPIVGAPTATGTANALMAGGLSAQMEELRKFAEWSSTTSFGIALTYSF